MRKFITFSLLLTLTFTCTSCLDILENFKINKDGSGSYSITIAIDEKVRETITQSMDSDFNSLKKELDQEDTEEIQGQDVQYKASLENIVEQLKTIKGISNAKIFYDELNFKYGFSYDFENLRALNKALETNAGDYVPQLPGNVQIGKKKKTYESKANYIEIIKNTLIRHQSSDLGKIMDMKKPHDNNAGLMGGLDVAYLLQDMHYTTTFEFEQSVKSVSNEAAVLSNENKKVVIDCQPFAYPSADKDAQKLHNSSCSQSLQIILK